MCYGFTCRQYHMVRCEEVECSVMCCTTYFVDFKETQCSVMSRR